MDKDKAQLEELIWTIPGPGLGGGWIGAQIGFNLPAPLLWGGHRASKGTDRVRRLGAGQRGTSLIEGLL